MSISNIDKDESTAESGVNQAFPSNFIFDLISKLKPRTKDIIIKRFGLKGDKKQTLEEIGQYHGITRERVRQIESVALSDLKQEERIKLLKPCEDLLESIISENGRVMEHNSLINVFSNKVTHSGIHEHVIEFILELSDRFKCFEESGYTRRAWGIRDASFEIPTKVVETVESILREKKKPVQEKEIVGMVLNHDIADRYGLKNKKAVKSYLSLSKKVLNNPFGEWGLFTWNEIVPKGVKDKAYMVLSKYGEPLHFTKITEKINGVEFSGKKAIPQTVHNELIKDKRFVLVGRGIYGLAEWGYSRGTVAEVIAKVLSDFGKSMERDQIIEEVLKQRIVKKNTIVLALQDKNRFKKVGERLYNLA
jgi:DNA-directed RNA polymerase delta subunit